MPRKRSPKTLPVGAVPEPTQLAPRVARDLAIPVVVPDVIGMLQTAKVILGEELRFMREDQAGGKAADATGQKIRNLVASIGSMLTTEKAATDEAEMSKLTKAELAAKLREEAARLEAEDEEET